MVSLGILSSSDKASANRSKPARAAGPEDLLPEYIHDAAQLPCVPPERPDLHQLNSCLEALAAIFPDVQVEVFRELLSNFDGESRLALVADALLKNRVTWVKGRWRVADKDDAPGPAVPRTDAFRSPEYKRAVRALAWHEFRGLSRSTIDGVLAESNYAYLESRRTLATLSSKSWRFTISSIFFRRKPVVAAGEAENHPLVAWRSTGQGAVVPTIRATGSAELDRELYEALVAPLKARDRAAREVADGALARTLNEQEAEAAGATYECGCCFATGPFEDMTACTASGHMTCLHCVHHAIREALFGQGWQSSVNAETGTLRCLSTEGDRCPGQVPHEQLHQAMMQHKGGADMLLKLDRRLADHSLIESQLPLIRCPFCNYAEIDELYVPAEEARLRIRFDSGYQMLFLGATAIALLLLLPGILLATLLCALAAAYAPLAPHLRDHWTRAVGRHSRRRRGLKFSCRAPDCGRVSCLSCHKAWRDVHVCHESSLVALRTQVEQAMSMAVKRVCPRCSTSFVKNAGCNKLTCPCGYRMCYVCRADLGEEGYRHFCDHFRPDGDPRPCKECDRCNLWESEDTERVLREAREEAERRWRDTEKRELSGSEKAFLATGYINKSHDMGLRRLLRRGQLPTVGEVCDLVIDTVFI
ncbi:Zinc finger, C6HC-type [Cordyceps fumosorosea ARSEF 2679]|uniref:Zinc finger, C6HC-type n=1 Tax=Cordyceps fumosorosea (strain ARSEF 2679) TaxID=1081104 RepID=A0A167U786_CORFA|nr:Zinc finger, C6HC-type [Cordyceps fumosorosea ARSEF 2679]OAA61308.1 Zinc finger, C6HC-type [Cordyceps fumosorosea ARSEF 2679]